MSSINAHLIRRQTCLGRSGQENRQGHPDNPFRASVQHLVVHIQTFVSLRLPLTYYMPPVGRATTTSGWACATMQRRRKSGLTSLPPSIPFDANATCAMAGSRFIRIQRSVVHFVAAACLTSAVEYSLRRRLGCETERRGMESRRKRRFRDTRYADTFFVPPSPCSILTCERVDTDGNAGPADPLAALEKSTTAQDHVNRVQIPRLESLQDVSDRYNGDPYALSSLVRKRFRVEKKIDVAKRAADDQLKGRYGLPETLQLAAEDDESKNAAREQWERGRREHEARTSIRKARLQSSAIPLSISSTRSPQNRDPVALFKARVLSNTRQSRTLKPPDRLK